jgi:hypothetical protein
MNSSLKPLLVKIFFSDLKYSEKVVDDSFDERH